MQIHSRFALLCLWFIGGAARADDASVGRRDYQIASNDPGIQISIREVMPPRASTFGEDRVVVFVHGHGLSARPAFDVPHRNASWAEWMAKRGYAVYLFDFRNCGWSTRERAMAEPPDRNPAPSRSYLALRDLGAIVDHVRSRHRANRVNLVGWPVKREVVIQGATHVAQFDPRREELFRAVEAFLSERM